MKKCAAGALSYEMAPPLISSEVSPPLATLVRVLDRVTQRVLYYKRLRNAFAVVDYSVEVNAMPQKPLPVVSDHLLHMPAMEANQRTPVVVGSERLYSWLAEEQNRSFSFRNALGTFTVRRERKRHGRKKSRASACWR